MIFLKIAESKKKDKSNIESSSGIDKIDEPSC